MTVPIVSLIIHGNYIDSFIYSGTLFLVTTDSRICTYKYEEIINSVIHDQLDDNNNKSELFKFIKDCREELSLNQDKPIQLEVNTNKLVPLRRSEIQLKGWPTDISVFRNKLYIAGEEGVDRYDFKWLTGEIDHQEPIKIWNHYSFKISPNSYSRIAIASGNQGVVAVFPTTKNSINMQNDVLHLTDKPSNDCEWIEDNLSFNTFSDSFLSRFESIPKKTENISEIEEDINENQDSVEKNQEKLYWESVNKIKRQQPEITPLPSKFLAQYLWISWKKIFIITKNGQILVDSLDYQNKVSQQLDHMFEENNIDQAEIVVDSSERILSARSGSFGTVIETSASLFLYNEKGKKELSQDPVSWRVFPRAKNYVNHLHIIEEDELHISLYPVQTEDKHIDNFAIGIEDVI